MKRAFILVAAVSVLALASTARAVCSAPNGMANGSEATPVSAFVDHGDGTVTHTLTGLMWKRCAQGLSGAACASGTAAQLGWSAALASAVADTAAGHTDWRVPNLKELDSMVETCGHSPAINTVMFPGTPPTSYFWTSTTPPRNIPAAGLVSFANGDATLDFKSELHHVRLVRGSGAGGIASWFDARQLSLAGIDVDGNGSADALTDGLLVIRYLFGLRGNSLIQNAIGAGAQRTTAQQIESFLQLMLPP